MNEKPRVLCAVYTRKSTEEGLDQDFNSLDAQRESAVAYIQSQRSEGWELYPEAYDDGGFSGGNMDRPALRRLLMDAQAGKFQMVVIYKIDRLTRSLKDFTRIVEILDGAGVSFVAVTQQFNTSTSMGRLTLNVLLSFAQFEREMVSERTRDKRAATAKKGKWLGGMPVLGYDIDPERKCLLVNEEEAEQVREMFAIYLREKSLSVAARALNRKGIRTKSWVNRKGQRRGGNKFNKANLSTYLRNPIYLGKLRYKDQVYEGEHEAILDEKVFARVAALLGANGKRKKSVNQDKHDFLLRGLVRCAACGSAMTPNFAYSGGRKYFYYKCVSVTKMDRNECPVRSVPARELEELVVDRLKVLAECRPLVDRVVKRAREATEGILPELRRELNSKVGSLNQLKEEARNLVRALGGRDGAERNTFVLERLDELQERQRGLEAEITRIKTDIARWEERVVDAAVIQRNMQVFREVWDRLEPPERKEVLALLLREVVYDEPKGEMRMGLRQLPDVGPFLVISSSGSFDESLCWLPG
jgi:site-specific DNA recombinase